VIPDPTTEEGMAEAIRRAKKRKAEAESARNRAKENPDEEPSGKLTVPSEIDLHRDRKNNDE
jgi:hypothetical protein